MKFASAMSTRIRIAMRNTARNRRRTLLNILMIAGGVAAIAVFHGYAHNLVGKLQDVTIQSQYGHIQVASNRTWKPKAGESQRDRSFLPQKELVEKIQGIPGVDFVSARTSFYGLISNGEQSSSAFGIGFDPATEHQLIENLRIIDGRNLGKGSKTEVIIGSGLRDQIDAKVGGSLTVVGYTYEGSINAVDADIVGVFESGFSEVDKSTFYVPLNFAQKLLDSENIERLVILLKSTPDTDQVRAGIDKILPKELGTRTWYELSTNYRQMVSFAHLQNLVIDWILLALALLSIANSVGMSISERTGEIGTVRALGNSRYDVFAQFLTEGLLLGFSGGVCGCILGYVIALVLNAVNIPFDMPGASGPWIIHVDLLPQAFAQAFGLSCFIAVLATIIPAYRASGLNVVEALKRNI